MIRSRFANWVGVVLSGLGILGVGSCVTAKPTQPVQSNPAPAPDFDAEVERVWSELEQQLTFGNRAEWFESRSEGADDISAALVRLLTESVGACYDWVAETCDHHHYAEAPSEPDEAAGIGDECAAQIIFVEQSHRITKKYRELHAEDLVLLPASDLGNAAELLKVSLDLVPFESHIEDYALLAVHARGEEGDGLLLSAAEELIEAQPASVRRTAFQVLAEQRNDPVVAMWAAESLAALGDSGSLPEWRADATLAEVAFQLHMFGSQDEEVPPDFVSRGGLTLQEVRRADAGTLEEFDPPQESKVVIPWGPAAKFPSPWDDADHLHRTAKPTRCEEDAPGGPRCRSKIDGEVTVVEFEAQTDGGFKVTRVFREFDFPNCML